MTRFERICIENIPLYSVFITVFFALLIFVLRQPVLIVTDDYFSAIYGVKREHYKRIEMSVRLYRQIKFVNIAQDNNSAEVVAFAVEDASKHPYFVVFPTRFQNALEQYKKDKPNVRCYVINNLDKSLQETPGVATINSKVELDYYRAGLCAGLLTKIPVKDNAGVLTYSLNERILFSDSETSIKYGKEMFVRGVKETAPKATVVTTDQNTSDLSDTYRVAVLFGHTDNILDNNFTMETSIIVYTWLDPDYTPPNALITIDDAPLSLLPGISKSSVIKNREQEYSVNADFNILSGRIADLSILPALRKAIFAVPK
ncbi:MAG: hypothetical protein LBV52_04575 [Spirochaetaceae bacterium]|jgi:basic membrane lipoprotein Med (substrate-binding protein (PBP1-ABC) superfamily)|nr:hypothetical protein [Spirochaetaceae bacterium]